MVCTEVRRAFFICFHLLSWWENTSSAINFQKATKPEIWSSEKHCNFTPFNLERNTACFWKCFPMHFPTCCFSMHFQLLQLRQTLRNSSVFPKLLRTWEYFQPFFVISIIWYTQFIYFSVSWVFNQESCFSFLASIIESA